MRKFSGKPTRFRPKYKIIAQSLARTYLYKNSRMRGFYYLRGKFVKRRGSRRNQLIIKNLKWTVIRKRMVSSFYRNDPMKSDRAQYDASYLIFLRKKQQLKKFYGKLNERKLLSFYNFAKSKLLNKTTYFLNRLEGRLDVLLLRTKMVPTIFYAQQYLSHQGVYVNGLVMQNCVYPVRKGDIISLKKSHWDFFYDFIERKGLARAYGAIMSIYRQRKKAFFKTILVAFLGQHFKSLHSVRRILRLKAFRKKHRRIFFSLTKIFFLFRKVFALLKNVLFNNYLTNKNIIKKMKYILYFSTITSLFRVLICKLYLTLFRNYFFRIKRYKVSTFRRFYRILVKIQRRLLIRLNLFVLNFATLGFSLKKANRDEEEFYDKLKVYTQIEPWLFVMSSKIAYAQIYLNKTFLRARKFKSQLMQYYIKLKKDPEENYGAFFFETLRNFIRGPMRKRLRFSRLKKYKRRRYLRALAKFKDKIRRKKIRKKAILTYRQQEEFVWWHAKQHWYIPLYLEMDFLTLRFGFLGIRSLKEIVYPFYYPMDNYLVKLKSLSF